VENVGIVIVIVTAMGFSYTNGFHDAANAIATSVSTRALTPRVALAMAAVFNLLGSFLGAKVASTVGSGIITLPDGKPSLVVVFAALIGAISWNLITWYFGLPSSSSHALIGGLVGAALAAEQTVKWNGVIDKVIVPMITSPLVGFVIGYLFMLAILWSFRNRNAHKTERGFRYAQIASSAAMAFGHGTQDAQKTMGIITLALVTSGHLSSFEVPLWVIFASALAMGLGTYSGGFRIIRTLGRRVIQLTPASGFAAQTVASGILVATATVFAVPISTTHVTTASIMGVGSTRRLSAVRWGVAGNIMIAWVLTLPAAGLAAAAAYGITHLIVG
jgi:phosphate/sulfate permease